MPDVPPLSGRRRRHADRYRGGADPDAQLLASRARAAIEFEADVAVEPDPEPLSLRDLGEGRLLWVPQGELAERPGPLDRIAGRHHPELKAPVIRLRLREGLDSAEYLADVRGEHARDLALEEALAVHLNGRPHRAGTEVPDPGDHVGGAAKPLLRAPVGIGDHPRVEARARHHGETLTVHRACV